VTDEEGKVELVQDVGRDYSGVSRLGVGGIRVRGRVVDCAVGVLVGLVRAIGLGANTTLELEQRRGDGCRLAVRGRQIVGDVFDEDAFTLRDGECED
jgi:hypothetical protein